MAPARAADRAGESPEHVSVTGPGTRACVSPLSPAQAWANFISLLSAPFHAHSAAELDNCFVTLGCNFPVWEALGTTAQNISHRARVGVQTRPQPHPPPMRVSGTQR